GSFYWTLSLRQRLPQGKPTRPFSTAILLAGNRTLRSRTRSSPLLPWANSCSAAGSFLVYRWPPSPRLLTRRILPPGTIMTAGVWEARGEIFLPAQRYGRAGYRGGYCPHPRAGGGLPSHCGQPRL